MSELPASNLSKCHETEGITKPLNETPGSISTALMDLNEWILNCRMSQIIADHDDNGVRSTDVTDLIQLHFDLSRSWQLLLQNTTPYLCLYHHHMKKSIAH